MIAPADSSPWMVRNAPSPRTADCKIIRNTREIAPNVPLMSLVRVCSSDAQRWRSEAGNSPTGEAHRLQDLGIAGIGIRDRVARDCRLVRRAVPAARHDLSGDREQRQDERPAEGQGAEIRMQHDRRRAR